MFGSWEGEYERRTGSHVKSFRSFNNMTRRNILILLAVFLVTLVLSAIFFRYCGRSITPPFVPAPSPQVRPSARPFPSAMPQPTQGAPAVVPVQPKSTISRSVSKAEAAPEPSLPNPVRPGVFPRLYSNDVIALPHGVWRIPLGFMADVQQGLPATSAVQGHCSKPQKALSPESFISMGFSQVGADWFFLGTPCHIDITESSGTIERLWVNQCLRRNFTTKKLQVDDPSCDGQRLMDLQAAQR